MNAIELTASQKTQISHVVLLSALKHDYSHPTGYNYVPDAVTKIQQIAFFWLAEMAGCGGNFGTYRKKMARPIILKPVEMEILKNVFAKVFHVTLEFKKQSWLFGWFDSCIYGCKYQKNYSVKILPKNLVNLEEVPLGTYYVRASWAQDNAFVENRLPITPPSVQERYALQRLHPGTPPDVLLKVQDKVFTGHAFLLATHSANFQEWLNPVVIFNGVEVETMEALIYSLHTATFPYDENTPHRKLQALKELCERYGFTVPLQECRRLLG
jgi:hypothetical protein